MTTTAPTTTVTSGCVKWFNTKAGYGFITLLDEATQQEKDVFVHHSEIQVSQSQYKYLVQGEYVECRLVPIEKEGHAIHATQVSGINGGKLMCETRNEARASRTPTQHERAPQTQQQQQVQSQQQQMPARVQQQRRPQQYRQTQAQAQPQLDPSDQDEWMIVRRRTQTDASSHTSSRQPYQQRRTTSSASASAPAPQAKQHRPPRQQPQQPKIEL